MVGKDFKEDFHSIFQGIRLEKREKNCEHFQSVHWATRPIFKPVRPPTRIKGEKVTATLTCSVERFPMSNTFTDVSQLMSIISLSVIETGNREAEQRV
jgi:hypothetical protein